MSRAGRRTKPEQFSSWCQRELSRILKSPVEAELMSYLLSIELKKDVEEYLEDMIGKKNKAVDNFLDEFFRRWRPPERIPEGPSSEEGVAQLVRPSHDEMVLFTKPQHKELTAKTTGDAPPGFSLTAAEQNVAPEIQTPSIESTKSDPQIAHSGSKTSNSGSKIPAPGKSVGKKQKFVPLLSAEGQSRATVMLPGRHTCQCLAQKHDLVNNCVECGRIVCSQEGSGPCVFCGALVCTSQEEEILTRDSKKGQKFKDKFLRQFEIRDENRALDHIQKTTEQSAGLSSAVEHKEKLLEYDQTSAKRTKVIDDESDYFSVDSNRWLSGGERQVLQAKEDALREQRHGSRRNKAVTLDFAGRQVVEEHTNTEVYVEKHAVEALKEMSNKKATRSPRGTMYNPAIPIEPPKYQPTHKGKRVAKTGSGETGSRSVVGVARLQDRTIQEMTDEGKCLSMHQPWASLLVAGIKTCEGRSWYTSHRGRLWIAATVQTPDQEEVRRLEHFYRDYHKDPNLEFPDYPTSCLLGCVDLVDCLPQEEYREQFPLGESESPYVFVVQNQRELIVKFSIKGQHKIWKLDSKVHVSAKSGLRPLTGTFVTQEIN